MRIAYSSCSCDSRQEFFAGVRFNGDNSEKDHFQHVIEHFKNLGMSSAYHSDSSDVSGEGSQSMLYRNRKENEPFDIDYVFLSKVGVGRVEFVKL